VNDIQKERNTTEIVTWGLELQLWPRILCYSCIKFYFPKIKKCCEANFVLHSIMSLYRIIQISGTGILNLNRGAWKTVSYPIMRVFTKEIYSWASLAGI
jgi:hypothetical protein